MSDSIMPISHATKTLRRNQAKIPPRCPWRVKRDPVPSAEYFRSLRAQHHTGSAGWIIAVLNNNHIDRRRR